MQEFSFEWDEIKNQINFIKHGITFYKAQRVFLDKNRILAEDLEHSTAIEKRYFCFGKIENDIVTVRFTYRNAIIRIIGAGYWRKGEKIYEQAQKKKILK